MSLFARSRIVADERPGGCLLLRSAEPLGDHPVTVLHSLRAWAGTDPDHPLVAERGPDGSWRTCSYGAAARAAEAVGQALLDRGLDGDRPLLVLSGNSIDHLLVTLGAMTAGIPVAPVSAAYSLQSRDHARLRAIAGLTGPGAVYAQDAASFGAALGALGGVPAITDLAELAAATPGRAVAGAFAGLRPGMVAKILFTSGSTGAPKGVLNTHQMLAANQQMIRQAWPFLAAERPVIVDWLPWSHTFGGNHNVGMMITAGGTIYIDAGRPVPALFGPSIANLADIPPTIYFNVPAGYAQLVPALEADPEFAGRFFSRLRLLFNAAAALPAALRDRLGDLAERVTGQAIPVTGSWGATETAPAVTSANFDYADARCIGTPLPGAEVKLVPADDADEVAPARGADEARPGEARAHEARAHEARAHEARAHEARAHEGRPHEGRAYEIRVKGPNVTPGYFGRPDLTAAAFDADGFYRSGDAVALADPADAGAGLVFRGRIAEDFKLATGTFVRVGAVRTALLSALPVLLDAVIAGENQACACALAWLDVAGARALLGRDPAADGELVVEEEILHKMLAKGLADHNAAAGSAARIERLAVLARPADLDAGEITDKGYVNQRRVLQHRGALVRLLYADPAPAGVIVAAAGD